MKVTRTRVKQYNSTYKTVISVDGEPVAITRSDHRASDIEAYLNGYDLIIADGRLKNTLDRYRVAQKKHGDERRDNHDKTRNR